MKSPINLFSPRLPTIYDIRSLEPNLPPRLGQARRGGWAWGAWGQGLGRAWAWGLDPGHLGAKILIC